MGDSLMATIILFAGNFAPRGFAFCEGQIINIAENTAVFSLLGTTYGGNGSTTFALPDLREAEKALGGARYIFALQGIFPSRD
jgi:microcystin-dependent protein